MAEKVGIENLKLVAKTGVDLGEKIATTFEDSKITMQEAFGFLPILMGVPDIISKKEAIKAEWKDLDDAERDDIKAYVAVELSLPNNPALERKIEKGISLVLDVVDFVGEFKK